MSLSSCLAVCKLSFESFGVLRTEYWLGVMNIFDFLSSGLDESEVDGSFFLIEVELVLFVTRLLHD